MALLTRKPRTASVVALEATTCGILEQSDFDQLLAEHPAAVRAMMAALAERLDAANRHAGIDFVNLSRVKIDPRVLRLLPQALVNEHKVVPDLVCQQPADARDDQSDRTSWRSTTCAGSSRAC